jgi:uncharacterized protein YciI
MWTKPVSLLWCLVGAQAFRAAAPQRRAFASRTSSLCAVQYLLTYDYIPDVLEKRGPFREGHIKLAKDMIAEGLCLSGGPKGPASPDGATPTGALFIFTEAAAAARFVQEDPYVSGGIVTGHAIEAWNVVVSKDEQS